MVQQQLEMVRREKEALDTELRDYRNRAQVRRALPSVSRGTKLPSCQKWRCRVLGPVQL
jgi:hypothetical protein